MPVELALGSPLAEALQNVVQPKLVELGWSTGGLDDSALSEYIILMLVNGKTQDQIASELSNDLLGLGPDDLGAVEFSRWLFDQVTTLHAQLGGSSPADVAPGSGMSSASQPHANGGHDGVMDTDNQEQQQNVEMGGTGDSANRHTIPTGPKAMRSGGPGNREKRILGQLNKAMDRTGDGVLHRVRATQGTGRINSHSQEPPKGPRNQANRGQRLANGRPMNNMQSRNVSDGAALNPLMNMTPQQQMQLFAMYEEQARVMAQILSPQTQTFGTQSLGGPVFNPAFQNGSQGNQQNGRSLFERVENKPQGRSGRPTHQFNKSQGHPQDKAMTDAHDTNAGTEPSSSMEVESSQQASADPAETVCRFNLSCSKADCPFAHQSPAAPPGTTIDVNDVCSFGAACKNRKCVARHPSPAKKTTHQAEQDCKFYPNCTNANCPFRHPDMPPCRNGADCSVPNCKFAHSKIECRYNPCLNAQCPFKHSQGQKRGAFEDKVWTADGEKKEHVSERKFVEEDDAEEELILPGSGANLELAAPADIVT